MTEMSTAATTEPGPDLSLASNEVVGVILAIASVGTILTMLVLVITMVCRRYCRIKAKKSVLMQEVAFARSNSTRASQRSQRISRIVADASEGLSTTNTFNINTQPLPDQVKTSPFPRPPDNMFPSEPEEIEMEKKDFAFVDGDSHMHHKMKQFPRSDLLLLDKLGEGEYGPIYRGEAYNLGMNDQSRPVTVKMLAQQDTDENRAMFNNDIDMLSSISHPNTVTMLAMCSEDSPECILLDAGLPGDLLTFIRDKKLEISPIGPTVEEAYNLLKLADEIATGMAYLTSERFVHKDLSLRNCIIGHDGVVKVAHFGLGPVLYPEAYYRVHDIDLPVRWMSPEAITSTNFTSASDVWAFGVVIWELFSYGELPFKDKSSEEVISYIVREFGKLRKPDRCSDEIFEVAKSCWSIEAHVRPGFAYLHDQLFRMAGQTDVSGSVSTFGSSPVPPMMTVTPPSANSVTNYH